MLGCGTGGDTYSFWEQPHDTTAWPTKSDNGQTTLEHSCWALTIASTYRCLKRPSIEAGGSAHRIPPSPHFLFPPRLCRSSSRLGLVFGLTTRFALASKPSKPHSRPAVRPVSSRSTSHNAVYPCCRHCSHPTQSNRSDDKDCYLQRPTCRGYRDSPQDRSRRRRRRTASFHMRRRRAR